MTSITRLLLLALSVGSSLSALASVSEANSSNASSEAEERISSGPYTFSQDTDVAPTPGKQVKVIVRVFIDTNGQQSQAQISQSSGHQQIDKAALKIVSKWKFVPGKRDGVTEAKWHIVPLNFHLK